MSGPRSISRSLAILALLLAAFAQAEICVGADEPKGGKPTARIPSPAILASAEGLKSIGGRWYLRPGQPPTYVYRDGDIYVDLFTYHLSDSNNDGIPNLTIRHDDRALVVESQGYPNHPTAIFPNSQNPNRIRIQDFHFRLPLRPARGSSIRRVPMGPIGMALNGVVFFNPFEAGGMNAIEGYSEVWLDSCCGHPQQHGVYHYHKYPSCLKSPFADDGQRHSPILGFAFDGFPIHGPYEDASAMARDLTGGRALDVCNGHSDRARGYHYHVTPGRFPYIIGGYAGIPEPSNNPALRRGTMGAIVDNADRSGARSFGIRSLTPGNAARGRAHTVTFTLEPETRGGIPPGVPSWVQIGPFEASRIARDGNQIRAEVKIPVDATVGVLLDAHVEFGNAKSDLVRVLKMDNAFRVVP